MGEPPRHFDSLAIPQILIITADPDARGRLASCLQENAFRVTVASNALAMEAFLNTGSVDLLVLDMTLPNQDGLSLCRRLCDSGRPVPLIMFSARNREQDRIAGLDAGADDYLIQPCSGRELVARIRALLRRCRVAPHPSAAVPEYLSRGLT